MCQKQSTQPIFLCRRTKTVRLCSCELKPFTSNNGDDFDYPFSKSNFPMKDWEIPMQWDDIFIFYSFFWKAPLVYLEKWFLKLSSSHSWIPCWHGYCQWFAMSKEMFPWYSMSKTTALWLLVSSDIFSWSSVTSEPASSM